MKFDNATSNAIIEQIIKDPTKIQKEVDSQYIKWYAHVLSQRNSKRELHKRLLPQPIKAWFTKSRLLWRYMKIWMSLNVLDGIIVNFTPMGGVTSHEVANNVNKTAKYDYKAMGLFNIDFQLKWHIGLFGLWCKLLPGWDSISNKPIADVADPLTIIPDPQNWIWSDMRYIWFTKRMNIYHLSKEDGYINIEEIKHFSRGCTSTDIDLDRAALLNSQDYEVDVSADGMVDIYYHYMTYAGRKYLTAWMKDRKILVKIHELKPKTKEQKADPRKIKFPVVLFRSDPIPGLFFGASIWDQIGQYQNVEEILDNLEIVIARKNAMGEDKIINTSVIDIKNFQRKQIWGRVIPAKLEAWERVSDSIFTLPVDNVGQFPQYINEKVKSKPGEVTWYSDIAFGISPDGNQTKWEIAALQENLNQFLSYSKTLIMHSEIEFWDMWYSFYVYNLSAKSTKHIAISKGNGPADLYEFKKSDFILDVPVIVEVKSKADEDSRKERMFARMQMIMGTLLPNMEKWSHPYNELLRRYLEYGQLERDEVMKYVWYSVDEIDALDGLELLNHEDPQKPRSPEEGDDPKAFILIYSLAKKSQVQRDIIEEYIDFERQIKKSAMLGGMPMEWTPWEADQMAQAQVWNMISQESKNNTMPSLKNISW